MHEQRVIVQLELQTINDSIYIIVMPIDDILMSTLTQVWQRTVRVSAMTGILP